MGDIGAPELLILLMLVGGLVGLVGFVWGLASIATTPESAFEAAGRSKGKWLAVMLVTGFLCMPAGAVAGWMFVLTARKDLRRTGVDRAPIAGWLASDGRYYPMEQLPNGWVRDSAGNLREAPTLPLPPPPPTATSE